MTGLSNGVDQPPGSRLVRIVKAFMNRNNDTEEAPDLPEQQRNGWRRGQRNGNGQN
jgi:hypothetical protein